MPEEGKRPTNVKTRAGTRKPAVKEESATVTVTGLLSGFKSTSDVKIVSQSFRNLVEENLKPEFFQAEGRKAVDSRRAMLSQVEGLLEAHELAQAENLSLGEAATKLRQRYAQAWEAGVVSLLNDKKNRRTEEAVRGFALFMENLETSKERYGKKIFTVNASASEIASETGLRKLGKLLAGNVAFPDPRKGRGFLVVQGWVGGTAQLKRLSRVTDERRCMLITDSPSFSSLDALRDAASEGGILEACGGEDHCWRHTILIANRGLVRQRFKGREAEENTHCYIPLSGPWFGMYLDRIAREQGHWPPVGYQNPIAGVHGVELELRQGEGQSSLYEEKNHNPVIRLSAGSPQVVVWGVRSMSKAGRGLQIGPAVVESLLIRYTDWVLNKWGIYAYPLSQAQREVQERLSDFVNCNVGGNGLFGMGSRVTVRVDEENRTLIVNFQLRFQELAESAVIEMNQNPDNREPANIKKAEVVPQT